jgi:hypothetical protein
MSLRDMIMVRGKHLENLILKIEIGRRTTFIWNHRQRDSHLQIGLSMEYARLFQTVYARFLISIFRGS